jgi:hypothetical protein
MDGIDLTDKTTAPDRRVVWQSPKEFATMLQTRIAWERSHPNATTADRKNAPKYPRLVLCVIEEKVSRLLRFNEQHYLLIMNRNQML